MEERRAHEQDVQGRKLRLSGNFKIGDDPERLASVIQTKGEEFEQLTSGLWSKKAVEKVEIARTGNQHDGGGMEIGAYVVMSSKLEADLLLQMIQPHKALAWGGKAVTAFICRPWKSKQARASVAAGTGRGGRKGPQQGITSTSSAARLKVVAQQQRQQQQAARGGAPLPVTDPSHFPALPKTVRWGGKVNPGTQQTPQAKTVNAAQRTTHAVRDPAPGGEKDASDDNRRMTALEEAVEALRVRGEAERQTMKEQITRMESVAEKLVLEIEVQHQATQQWQQHLQKILDTQTAQLALLSEEVRTLRLERADGSCSPVENVKKRLRSKSKSGAATDTTQGLVREATGAQVTAGEEEDMDEHDEEVGDSMRPLSSDAMSFDATANSSTAHPQPVGLVGGVGH
jgi:hypothetical protein